MIPDKRSCGGGGGSGGRRFITMKVYAQIKGWINKTWQFSELVRRLSFIQEIHIIIILISKSVSFEWKSHMALVVFGDE